MIRSKHSKYIIIFFFVILGISANFIWYVKDNFNRRGKTSLINQYFKLRDSHPSEAKHALERLLQNDPANLIAMRELGYWYIRQGDINSALKQFIFAHKVHSNDIRIMLELGKLYSLTKQYSQAKYLLNEAVKTNDLHLRQQAQIALNQIPVLPVPSPTEAIFAANTVGNLQIITVTPPPSTPKVEYIEKIPEITISNKTIISQKSRSSGLAITDKNKKIPVIHPNERDALFNQYYAMKKNHSPQAWKCLQTIVDKYPQDSIALKEAGYTTLNAKNNEEAYGYFKRAYEITGDPQLAMQLGYILVNMNKKRLAYYYFNLATNTKNTQDLIAAEMAKTNLTPAQVKLLPEPYYADVFYDPFYYSRFKMIVQPLVVKAGKLINEKYHFKAYLAYQRKTDNRSGYTQQLPQIFEDNVSITALGAQINPIPSAPLTAFVEAGKAVDLVYQNRSRWRSDLRSGLAYYKEWGDKLTYTLEPVFSAPIIGDFYSDMIYFSRYRDIIGSVRLREGIRIFKYETSSIDLYLKSFIVWDTAHQYYNNIIEWGPGIAITPSNRYNVVLHLEALQGHYIPVASPSPNPYPSNYHNNLLQFNCYFRL